MEKCNCDLCQRREFFTGFDKNGKYAGEVTETPLSVYDQLTLALTRFNMRGCVNELTVSVAEAMDRIDEIDTALMEMTGDMSKEEIFKLLTKLRGELY